ncbi:hypothetical protein [Candidatus Phytoplasma sp. AldY-WA1]|uniref:hypothetical protein n=1 Tax=Candidatus Phytoplasma sp. AldY-WA1 TaxID=2852100 RepID=UPI00254D077A|nr:hypothetical protein [Candidatus Phytoplasma sp. AldY-WA1]
MITTISCMLFMRTFTFWFILGLSSFLFILFVYYKNSQRTKKPLNFIFLTILFIAIFVLSIGTWYYCYGRKPKLANQAKTVATQAKTVAQTGATQAKNAAAKPIDATKNWWDERKQKKEAKNQAKTEGNEDNKPKDKPKGETPPKDEGSDDNNKGSTAGEKVKSEEKPTDKPVIDEPKIDESTTSPDKSTNKTNKPKTVNDLITDARKQIDEICKTYKTQYNTLIDKLEEIKDNITNQTAELAKTPSQVTRINNLINEINGLITVAEKEKTFLKRDVDSIIEQIEELEKIITLPKDKKQELLKKDKATIISYIATEIKTINDNLGELYEEKNKKIGELKETTEQITTINGYITKLETINKNYETKMENLTNDKEIKARILEENQKQVTKLKEQLIIHDVAKKDLKDKEAFYTILKLSLFEAKGKYLQRKDTMTVKNDTAFDSNKAFNQGKNLIGKLIDNVTVGGFIIQAYREVTQTDINRAQAIEENRLKNEKANYAFDQQKAADAKQELENTNRRKEVDAKKTEILNRYHTFLNLLYDSNGNIIPLSPESVEELQKTFDTELENDRKEFTKIKNECNKIETNIANKTNEKTNYQDQIKDQHELLEETKSFNQTVTDLKVELAKNKDKSPVSQEKINDIDLDILKEKVIRNQLIELNDKLKIQNPNINKRNKELVEKAKVDYNALSNRLINGSKTTT